MDENVTVIDRATASRLTVLLLLVGFALFVGGYFVGKRQAFAQFMDTATKESLTDQIYSSVHTLFDTQEQVPVDLDEATGVVMNEEKEESVQDRIYATSQEPATQLSSEKQSYFAVLASFRREQDADALRARLKKHHIEVHIKTISSKSKQGKLIKWFQVVSATHNDKNELEKLIGIIKKLEKINDIAIKKGT